VQGKHQGQGAQGLLPTRQVGNVLPALLWRPHTENYTLYSHTSSLALKMSFMTRMTGWELQSLTGSSSHHAKP